VAASPGKDGYSVTTTSDNGTHLSETDRAFSTLRWVVRDPAAATELLAVRQGNRIELEGTVKGRKFQKTHSVDEDPWYQEWGLGLREFSRGSENRHYFWSINPGDPNMITKFEATRSAGVLIRVAMPGRAGRPPAIVDLSAAER
jgi:hypothetical protein